MRYIIVQQEETYVEYPIIKQIKVSHLEFVLLNNRLYCNGKTISPYIWMEEGNVPFLYLDEEERIFERRDIVFISENEGDICIPHCSMKLTVMTDKLVVEQYRDTLIYLNQKKIGNGTYALEPGSVLFIENCKIILEKEYVVILGSGFTTGLLETKKIENSVEHFPSYKRSPRLIKHVEDTKVVIASPPTENKMGKKGLAQMILPPLCMLLVTVAIGIVMKRGFFMLMSISATVMTTVFSAVKYLQDRKDYRETEAKKKELYNTYLLEKRREVYALWKKEADTYQYNYPEISELSDMVHSYSSRIYEHSSLDDDFLTFSVGHYKGNTAFTIEDKINELEIETNELTKEVKEIRNRFHIIDQPQIIDLKHAHLGIVGDAKAVHEQLNLYISQIAFFQSYHDVEVIVVYDKEYEDDFSWMRWLPHTRLRTINVLGLISSERLRDQILSSMQQILKERRQKLEEDKKETRFLPHYIFIIDEPKMIMDHSIMEFLSDKEGSKLGFSLIYTTNQRANLPENIGTVLMLDNLDEGRLLIQEKEFWNQKLNLYRIGTTDLDMMARDLGVLVHEQGMTSHIPESITFFDMYGIQEPEELQIQNRWNRNHSSKSLAIPIGARTTDDYLELNLHEKAHGPHGLIAGTTGSGKSELVQSYILSLAVNFHPYEVGFLLIDYKGGGMANLFKDLPHLLGIITNLDGSESMRALASIQSELRRRQRIFNIHEVNHINAYNDLFKEGKAKEPIPHLFIISDEFAELKKEQPEFMKELVSTARIGRSLGVHLILATQKPTGIVDDQIWTNSKFKLCLKVQNEADSKEVLHTPDAANITQVGRAYLQVGNNEIYELFQSAWSGAMYIKETEREVTQDNRVYLVNELGQGELINQDLRGAEAKQRVTDTQLDVVVRHIHDVYMQEQGIEVKRPWLPALPAKLVNPHMNISSEKILDLNIRIGLRDIPEEQEQTEYRIDLQQQGNIAYIASGGYGKSVFLTNAALYLAAKNRVSNLNLYVLDFGNNALISLCRLPHMAEYIMLDDIEKFGKFRDLILSEIYTRKKILASVMAQNFTVYNEMANHPLKAIVILIDNYDAIKELGFEMEEYFTKITRDGVGLGIYVIVTASRGSAIRYATLNNFKNKIAGVNFDENEIKSLVGRSQYSLGDIKGRTFVKDGESINVMQLYTPVAFENEMDYSKNVQKLVMDIADAYPYEEAPHIPILPEELTYESLLQYKGKDDEIAIGLDKETVLRSGFTRQNSPFLILGEGGSGKTNVLRLIMNQIKGEEVYVIDSRSRGLYKYKNQVQYISNLEALEDFVNYLNEETKRRKQYMDMELDSGGNPEEIINNLKPLYIIVDDIDDFCDMSGSELMIIAGRFERAASYGVTFIVTASVNKFKGTDDFTRFIKNSRNGLLLSNQGYLTIFPVKVMEQPEKPDGFLTIEGKGTYVRIPSCDISEMQGNSKPLMI